LPVIRGTAAPVFTTPDATFVGLASPSRGAEETCVWRTIVPPGAQPRSAHSFDREEVLVAVSGRAVASLDEVASEVAAGDAIVVPARTAFSLANPYDEPFEAVVSLPVGAVARMADGQVAVPFIAR
jgi:mannose-6-phosphate isomerase-like protein (cupin superfamily)